MNTIHRSHSGQWGGINAMGHDADDFVNPVGLGRFLLGGAVATVVVACCVLFAHYLARV